MVTHDANQSNNFSIEHILALRSEAFAAIRMQSATIQSIANAVESLDAKLQFSVAHRGLDPQAELFTAAQSLATLLSEVQS